MLMLSDKDKIYIYMLEEGVLWVITEVLTNPFVSTVRRGGRRQITSRMQQPRHFLVKTEQPI